MDGSQVGAARSESGAAQAGAPAGVEGQAVSNLAIQLDLMEEMVDTAGQMKGLLIAAQICRSELDGCNDTSGGAMALRILQRLALAANELRPAP